MTFTAHVSGSSINFRSPYEAQKFYEKAEGKRVTLQIEEKPRSLSQNAYYWVFLGVIGAETGNDPEDLHAFFKRKLLPIKTVQIKGKQGTYEVEKLTSTRSLTKLQFAEYLDRICALTGVPLPNPEDAGYLPS